MILRTQLRDYSDNHNDSTSPARKRKRSGTEPLAGSSHADKRAKSSAAPAVKQEHSIDPATFASQPDTKTYPSSPRPSQAIKSEDNDPIRTQIQLLLWAQSWSGRHREKSSPCSCCSPGAFELIKGRRPQLNPELKQILEINNWECTGMVLDATNIMRATFVVGNMPKIFSERWITEQGNVKFRGKEVRWRNMPFCQPPCALSLIARDQGVERIRSLKAEECTLGMVMPLVEKALEEAGIPCAIDSGVDVKSFVCEICEEAGHHKSRHDQVTQNASAKQAAAQVGEELFPRISMVWRWLQKIEDRISPTDGSDLEQYDGVAEKQARIERWLRDVVRNFETF